MRVGIFGGTFNPVHLGHLRVALDVKDMFCLDKVLFVPTGIPPHKKDDVAPIGDRMNMLKIAIANVSGFEVSDIEAHRNGICYAVDTVGMLKERYRGVELFYIVGIDAFASICTWKRYEELLRNISFIVMMRPGCIQDEWCKKIDKVRYIEVDEKGAFPGTPSTVYLCPVTQINISSSFIRLCVKRGGNINYFTPKDVVEYIERRGLYKG
ncbi:MAG: nicotinate-nucleotide adenylyltransferase [Deltaproteobacteria bacterium]|nr:nicotinate-nucleotide adenylyltransferase [Deltaproteobacteria bacterium]